MSDLRESIRESIGELNAGPIEVPEAVGSVSGGADGDSVSVAAPEPGTVDGNKASPDTVSVARVRDEKGKFAAKAKAEATEAPKPATVTPTAKPEPGAVTATPEVKPATTTQTPPPEMKAPQSWKPDEREAWAQMPPKAREAALRREKEITSALQEAAPLKKFQADFQQAVAPFEAMIRAEGGEPIRAVGSLMQTAAALRTAPASHVAGLISTIVKQFGTDRFGAQFIAQLDDALSGGQGQQAQRPDAFDPAQLRQQIKNELLQDFQGQRQQVASQKAQQEVTEFASKAEFFEDVRADMLDIMASASSRGVVLTLQQAYDKACKLDDRVFEVLQQRKAAEAANASQASTQQALQKSKNAASSVKSQPASEAPSPKADSLRGSIREAIAELGGRR